MVRYGDIGYRNVEKRKLEVSRDVIFMEERLESTEKDDIIVS